MLVYRNIFANTYLYSNKSNARKLLKAIHNNKSKVILDINNKQKVITFKQL